jgi:hypothetical protein
MYGISQGGLLSFLGLEAYSLLMRSEWNFSGESRPNGLRKKPRPHAIEARSAPQHGANRGY